MNDQRDVQEPIREGTGVAPEPKVTESGPTAGAAHFESPKFPFEERMATAQESTAPAVNAVSPGGAASPEGGPLSEDTPPNKQPEEDKASDNKAITGDLRGKNITVANQIRKEIQNNYILPNTRGPFRLFSENDFCKVGKTEEDEITKTFVCDPQEMNALLQVLSEKRLLILSGDPDIGKATTALYLGKKLAELNTPDIEFATYLTQALDRQVRINLRELCADNKLFGGRLVVFEDALSHGNSNIMHFFEQLKRGISDITERLRKNRSYLILTSETSKFSKFHQALSGLGICQTLQKPSTNLLDSGLETRLSYISGRMQSGEVKIQNLRAGRQLVFDEFKTLPLMVRFVEYYCNEPTSPDVSDTLKDAIHRFKDIASWFRNDLPQDFAAWCFGLSLCLAQVDQNQMGASWMTFERLWRLITLHLKRDPEIFRSGSNKQPGDEEFGQKTRVVSESVYLDKCRAEINKDTATLSDMIRFRNPSYPRELWKTLLAHYRYVLTSLLPLMNQIVETEAAGRDASLSALAARIIGRAGEMDPAGITLETMNRWVQAGYKRTRASIGYLYRGVLESEDPRYWEFCLNGLKMLAPPDNENDDESEEQKENQRDRLLTAIGTYRHVGIYDLPLAMRELQTIAADHLDHLLWDTQQMERLFEQVKLDLERSSDFDTATDLVFIDGLRDLAYGLFSEKEDIFLTIQMVIVTLCQELDPIRVFHELRSWISSSQTMGLLVTLMFLQGDGIASQLEERQILAAGNGSPGNKTPHRKTEKNLSDGNRDISEKDEHPAAKPRSGIEPRKANRLDTKAAEYNTPIILSLLEGDKAVERMARFLGSVYESISVRFSLPEKTQRYFRTSFFQHLKIWVTDAMSIENARQAMEDLFVELLQIRGGMLYEPIYQFLAGRDFNIPGSDMKALADAVIKRA